MVRRLGRGSLRKKGLPKDLHCEATSEAPPKKRKGSKWTGVGLSLPSRLYLALSSCWFACYFLGPFVVLVARRLWVAKLLISCLFPQAESS